MDYGKSFSYVFEDKDWVKKLVVGGLLSVVPILNLIPCGYALRTVKAVGENREKPLPEWDDLGGDLVKGLLLVVGWFVYFLPSTILGGVVQAVNSILQGASAEASSVAGVCLGCGGCLAALLGLVAAVMVPAATVKYAQSGEFVSFFRFGEIWALLKDHSGDYIIAILLSMVAGFIAGFGVLACVVGLAFTTFWSLLVSAHLFGQILAKMAPAAPGSPVKSGPSYGELQPGELSGGAPTPQA
jgi:hypothetical protein